MRILFIILIGLISHLAKSQLPYSSRNDSSKVSIIDSNKIIYFLPSQVEGILSNEIKEKEGDTYFELSNKQDGTFQICVFHINKKSEIFWPLATNRMLYLAKEFYPLVFDYDNMFATSDRGNVILLKSKQEGYMEIGRARSIQHYYFYVIFKGYTGEIIKSGYDGIKSSK